MAEDHRYPLSRFMSLHLDRFNDRERAMILTAIHMAVKYHGDKPRRTGEPGWEHCLYTASMVWESGLGAIAIVCALLHDIIEDCDESQREQLKAGIVREFGDQVLEIVLYLTKTSKNTYVQQLVEGAQKHFEVAFVKLADRIHNVSTVALLTDNRTWQRSYLRETLDEMIPTLERCTGYIPRDFRAQYKLQLVRLQRDTQEALQAVSCLDGASP